MSGILKGVTKNDLLKLKGSKPVPITAHSNEVVVPVVYATRVKQFMKKEGMSVPLSPEQLSTLKSKARDTVGTMDASYAVGGSIKSKKAKAKAKAKKTISKIKTTGNIKQIVNIKLGEKAKIIRRPSVRAKAVGKENIPIRPGVSTYPMGTEPAYSRMIPSTGASNQPTKPLPLMLEDAKPPLSSSVAKPGSMPGTIKPTVVDVLRWANIAREAAKVGQKRLEDEPRMNITETMRRPFVAGEPIPTSRKTSKGPSEEISSMMKHDKLMIEKAKAKRSSSVPPSPPIPSLTPAQSRGRAIIAARK